MSPALQVNSLLLGQVSDIPTVTLKTQKSIVVNGKNETYGFPSKIEDDPVLAFVIKGDRSIDYAEERRLLYVAMTRTKNRVFMVAPEKNPSEFLLEIKKDYKNVVLRGEWNTDPVNNTLAKKTCPICGYPLQFRYKNSYGLRLYICTNEPEICGFMTNEYKAGKLSIMKCDQCRDGYLIVKPGKENQYFLGCTNYNKAGTGCSKFVTPKLYYDMFKLTPDPVPAKEFPKAKDIPPKYDHSNATENKKVNVTNEVPTVINKAKIKSIAYGESDLNDIVHKVLLCLSHVSEKRYYGITTLVDVLRGAQSKKITEADLDKVSEYASLNGVNREDLVAIIEWLIENHYILKTKGMYPVLHPTYEGLHYDETITANKLKKLSDYLSGKE
jgi:DNA helicase-4